MSPCLQQLLKQGFLAVIELTRLFIQCKALQLLQAVFISLISNQSVIGRMVAIATILIGLTFNQSVIRRVVVKQAVISCGWIDTGGRRGREVEGEAVAVVAIVVAAVIVVTVVWFMACRRSAKDRWGCTRLFFLSYIGLKRQ